MDGWVGEVGRNQVEDDHFCRDIIITYRKGYFGKLGVLTEKRQYFSVSYNSLNQFAHVMNI